MTEIGLFSTNLSNTAPSIGGLLEDKMEEGLSYTIDIIANNPTDQKVVERSSSQHYSLVEHSMYRSVFPPQGGEGGVFLPESPRASKTFGVIFKSCG
jgi:hypothetical protein